jgi:SAM-dependent methyltransferase
VPYKNTGEWVSSGHWSETENSSTRRGKSFFEKYLKGKRVIDIGSGHDAITTNSYRYDSLHNENFDATFVKEVENESFDVVYASHVLEHLAIPYLAIRNWWRILKGNGHLIIAVPDRNLYERKTELPSVWNSQHKIFILANQEDLPYTINLDLFLRSCLMDKQYEIEYMRVCSNDVFDSLPEEIFGKNHPMPEYQIETIIRKL